MVFHTVHYVHYSSFSSTSTNKPTGYSSSLCNKSVRHIHLAYIQETLQIRTRSLSKRAAEDRSTTVISLIKFRRILDQLIDCRSRRLL
jgi:hypothetical protein